MANHNPFKVTALAAALAAVGAVTPAYALFEHESGDFKIQADTTISVGAGWRISGRDYRSVGVANATQAANAGDNPAGNVHLHGTSLQDDGNLFWKKGATYSEVVKITADVEMNYKNYGAFVRGKTFYDNRIVNNDGVTDRPAFYYRDAVGNPMEPNQSVGTSGDILDAFVWGDYWIGDMPLNLRVGRQVISWGESVLFANGINTINPIDVNAILTPGSEVKDALIPLTSIYGSLGITENFSLESFVLLEWKNTELPACGTFFSTSDLAGDCWAGFYPSGLEASAPGSTAVVLPRGPNEEAHDGGQFGVAGRYFAQAIETEFGVYYINYHSQAPIISGHMPDLQGITTLPFVPGLSGMTLAQARTFAQAASNATNITARLLPSADFFIEYPEDIQLFGASFNTTLDMGLPGGATSVAGEVSMRKDQPFQLEDGDTLAGAIGLPSISCKNAPTPFDCYSKYAPGAYAPGYIEEDYFQAEVAFIHFFDQILGASRWTALLDIAGSYLTMPDKDFALLNSAYNATLNHPYTPTALVFGSNAGTPANPADDIYIPYRSWLTAAYAGGAGSLAAAPEDDYYPTSGAWGYKMRFTGDYPNVFAGINLRPAIAFSHDVDGVTPGPITNFIKNRKSLGLSLEAEYLNTYTVGIGYTDFYGAEPYNQLADRDFATISASASF